MLFREVIIIFPVNVFRDETRLHVRTPLSSVQLTLTLTNPSAFTAVATLRSITHTYIHPFPSLSSLVRVEFTTTCLRNRAPPTARWQTPLLFGIHSTPTTTPPSCPFRVAHSLSMYFIISHRLALLAKFKFNPFDKKKQRTRNVLQHHYY